MISYSPEGIRVVVECDQERLFAAWSAGRPDTWKPDARTRDIVCIGLWLREELSNITKSDDDRRSQEAQFNRRSRSEFDLYAIAAEVLNEVVENRIDRNRVPLRRWG